MTIDVFQWEGKHTRAVIVIAFVVLAAILFHREERKWLSAVLGVGAAATAFL